MINIFLSSLGLVFFLFGNHFSSRISFVKLFGSVTALIEQRKKLTRMRLVRINANSKSVVTILLLKANFAANFRKTIRSLRYECISDY